MQAAGLDWSIKYRKHTLPRQFKVFPRAKSQQKTVRQFKVLPRTMNQQKQRRRVALYLYVFLKPRRSNNHSDGVIRALRRSN